MDTTQNFNDYPTQNFNPLFFMNASSYANQNNNNFNQINLMNQMNNNINFNMNNFNQMNQMNNNLNFNMNNFNQMNQMNNNININMNNNDNNNNNDNIIDFFPYIKEQKKIIKFINSNYKSNFIKIPISINKSELYSIADNYKSHPLLKFILSYKNIMIKEDESSIEEIPEGAEINIIEERPIPNTCYYDSLKKKYGDNNIINITFILRSGMKRVLHFPGEATLSDVKKSYYNKYGLNESMSILLYNEEKLKDKDEKRIQDIGSNLKIEVLNPMEVLNGKKFGKIILGNVTAKIKTEEKENIVNFKINVGSLNSTSRIYEEIEGTIGFNIKKLFLNNKEISRNHEQSLKSLGIKEDFNVLAEL